MKYAKYKFGKEIQTWPIYTKSDIGRMLTPSYRSAYWSDKIIDKFLEEDYDIVEAIDMTITVRDELLEQLPDREYLHIEFLNIHGALPDVQKALQMEKDYKKIWKNVLSTYEEKE